MGRRVCRAGAVALLVLLVGCFAKTPEQQLEKVQDLLAQRDYRSALIILKGALDKTPQDAGLRWQLGRVLLEAGDPSGALVELERALELGHPDTQVVPLLVRAAAYSGRAPNVVDRFGATQLSEKPAQAELKLALALAHGAQGQTDAARAATLAALALNPELVEARILQASFLAGDSKFDEAWTIIESVTHDSSNSAHAWFIRGILERRIRNDPAASLKSLQRALQIDPRHVMSHGEILSIHFEGNDRAAMRKQMAAMQAALPSHFNTLLYRAHLEYLEGNLKASRDLLQQLQRTSVKSFSVALLAGRIELQLGALTLAETQFNTALQLQPDNALARHLLATVYIRQGQHAKALQALESRLGADSTDATALGLAGESLMHQGEMARAQAFFERAAKVRPEDQRLRAAVALSRMAQGQVDQGLVELENVAKAGPDSFADLALISTLLKRGSVADARAAVERLQAKMPGRPLPYHLRGQIDIAQGDETAARAAFAEALVKDPLYYPSASSLAALDAKANKLDDAAKRFRSILEREPKHLQATLALAEVMVRRGEPAPAIDELLARAIQANPVDLSARLAAVNLQLREKDYRRAVTVAQEGLAVLPDAPALLNLLGAAQMGSREYQQAMSTFRKLAIAVPTAPEPHLRMAEVHLAQNDRAAAKASVRRALEVSPELLPAQAQLVDLTLAEGNAREALSVARRVQKSQPKSAVGYVLEGRVQEAQSAWPAAASAYRTALSLKPNTESAVGLHRALVRLGQTQVAAQESERWRSQHPRDALYVVYLADSAMFSRRWSEAEALYREVIRLAPNHMAANNNIAWTLMKQGKSGALAYARKAAAQAPDDPAVQDTLANAAVMEGDAREGLQAAEKILAGNPEHHEARLTIAKAAIRLGDQSRARKELEGLLYLGEKFPEQQEVAALMRTLK